MSKRLASVTADRATLRLADVQRMTGWPHQYIRKLVQAGVLRVVRHPGTRAWYCDADVARLREPHAVP